MTVRAVNLQYHTKRLFLVVALLVGVTAVSSAETNATYTQPVPIGVSPRLTIASGQTHTCVLGADDSVRCWGANDQYRTSTSHRRYLSEATQLVLPGTAQSIGVGQLATCAVLTTGDVYCLGYDSGLIDMTGRTYQTETPTKLVGLSGAVAAIDVADSHACALLVSGGVECWGNNSSNRIAPGVAETYLTPTSLGLSGAAVDVALGATHTCVLLATGAVQCRGDNSAGQLGNGTTTVTDALTTVVGVPAFVAIDATEMVTCGTTAAGAVWCWGPNQYGQLGNGTTVDTTMPVHVTLGEAAARVVVGRDSVCSVTVGGALVCWGQNTSSQFGPADLSSLTPVAITTLGSVSAVSIGSGFSCVMLTTGAVSCVGANDKGQLGNGAAIDSLVPYALSGTDDAVVVQTGESGSCYTTGTGALMCWGYNRFGAFGAAESGPTPTAVTFSSNVASYSLSQHALCVVLDTGEPVCQGRGVSGQFGTGVSTARGTFSPNGISTAYGVATSNNHTCWITDHTSSGSPVSRGLLCSGHNGYGQLGGGTVGVNALEPVVVGFSDGTPLGDVAEVRLGSYHSCARTTAGTMYCWGANSYGQAGQDPVTYPYVANPTAVGAGTTTSIGIGSNHTCATTVSGVVCFGTNAFGQLGRGTVGGWSSTPTTIVAPTPSDVSATVAQLSVGGDTACVRYSNGEVFCFGNNAVGQTASNNPDYRVSIPERALFGSPVTVVSAGTSSTCAVISGGGVACSGSTSFGMVGYQLPTPLTTYQNVGQLSVPAVAPTTTTTTTPTTTTTTVPSGTTTPTPESPTTTAPVTPTIPKLSATCRAKTGAISCTVTKPGGYSSSAKLSYKLVCSYSANTKTKTVGSSAQKPEVLLSSLKKKRTYSCTVTASRSGVVVRTKSFSLKTK